MKRINILSTRLILPALIEQAEGSGIQIDQKEFIRTTSLITPEKADIVQHISADTDLVFTSTNAVEALSKLVHEYNIHPGQHRVFCVDGRTSLSINTLFPSFIITTAAETAQALAEEMLKHEVQQVCFVCGNLRRDELPAVLHQNGIAVTELELYRTETTPVKMEQHFDGLIFFSPSAVVSFFSLNKISAGTTCFAIGHTTANAIKKYTSNEIVVAAKPRQDNIISRVIKHYQSR